MPYSSLLPEWYRSLFLNMYDVIAPGVILLGQRFCHETFPLILTQPIILLLCPPFSARFLLIPYFFILHTK
jgi:hypothetical protein